MLTFKLNTYNSSHNCQKCQYKGNHNRADEKEAFLKQSE